MIPAHLPRYVPKTFAAFRIGEGGTSRLSIDADDLQGALNAALPACIHKDKLAIREADEETGETVVHLYVIRRRAPMWVQPAGEIMPRRVCDHYAELVATLPGEVFGG